jgi:phosphate:Na+ symporter
MVAVMPVLTIQLLGGLALFLGGLKMMSKGLEKLCGSALARAVRHYTGTRASAFLVGVLFTAVTQSSSLATVIVIGVVDAGILGLPAAIAVIIGANVGTTVTGQLLSFHLQEYAPWLAVLGLTAMIWPRPAGRPAGRSLLGLAGLLWGLEYMGAALVPMLESPAALELLRSASRHPAAAVLAGAAVTAVVQSSSAVVGAVIALATEGAITLRAGAGIMVGADVGTCVTSLLAGLGAGTAARRAALSHLLFNLISVLLVLPFFAGFVALAAASSGELPRQLANAHTLYNLGGAVLLMLWLKPFARAVEKLSPPQKRE